ncbi:MAG: hypothetical protein ACQEWV_25260 [Bacillota bacterium]
MFIKLFLALNILTAFQPLIGQENPSQPPIPEIISIHTDFPKDGIWVLIPKGTEEITFNVEAKNTETVLFWLIPTGTQTWTERELIGYDIKESPTDNNFTLTWKIDKPNLHDYLHIQAIGEGVANNIINLSMN